VALPETPGALLKFCALLGRRNITEFNYRYFDGSEAHVFAGIQVLDYEQEGPSLIAKLRDHGFHARDLTENELAKEHVRYMVGGRPPRLLDEVLYRIEFPERPGALSRFLSSMSHKWNISLFHYRNHGAAFGRVLIGIQVPKDERKNFDAFIKTLDFATYDETNNPAYRVFLKN
jgi:threonine dehydratase